MILSATGREGDESNEREPGNLPVAARAMWPSGSEGAYANVGAMGLDAVRLPGASHEIGFVSPPSHAGGRAFVIACLNFAPEEIVWTSPFPAW
jgi:hypothetical protein